MTRGQGQWDYVSQCDPTTKTRLLASPSPPHCFRYEQMCVVQSTPTAQQMVELLLDILNAVKPAKWSDMCISYTYSDTLDQITSHVRSWPEAVNRNDLKPNDTQKMTICKPGYTHTHTHHHDFTSVFTCKSDEIAIIQSNVTGVCGTVHHVPDDGRSCELWGFIESIFYIVSPAHQRFLCNIYCDMKKIQQISLDTWSCAIYS